jgi:hypothetical protein
MERVGEVRLDYDSKLLLDNHNMAIAFINNQPFIFDLRDDNSLPLELLRQYPSAKIFKANFSHELWTNPPAAFETPHCEEDRKFHSQIIPFVFGRSFTIPFDADELSYFHPEGTKKYSVVSLSGEGVYALQTNGRLIAYDFISKCVPNTKLYWYARRHFQDKDGVVNYEVRKAPFIYPGDIEYYWGNYRNYLNLCKEGNFVLNLPGIACSNPFRCVDSVLSGSAVLSTKLWNDAYRDFPMVKLPFCGYFGTGDFENARTILEMLPNINIEPYVQKAREWYDTRLSAKGMWEYQIKRFL